MVDIPPELWAYIGSSALREDLIQLALVSQRHLALVRPILAEEVTIRARKENDLDHQKNLQFLVKTQLSTNIKSFSIAGFASNGAPDIPFDAMPNLRTLVINDCKAFSANKQKQMVTSLQGSCTELRTIKVHSLFMFSHKEFSISNVVTVEWSETGHLTPSLFSLCQASLSTITNLNTSVRAPSWPVADFHHEGIKTYQRFFRLRFPSLLSLNVGPGHNSLTSFGEDEMDGAFTKFLLAHRTLEKLVLPHWQHGASHTDIYLPVDAESLAGSNTLPALRYFEAHPELIAELLQEEAHFLTTTVESLCITEAEYTDNWTWDEIIEDGLEEDVVPLFSVLYRLGPDSGTTLALKHLIVHLSKTNDDETAVEFIKESLIPAAKSFPKLESWVGSIPVTNNDDFVRLFSQFPRLRTISGVLGLMDPIEEESVLEIATACKYLERVNCLAAPKSFLIDRIREGDETYIKIQQEEKLPHFSPGSPEFEFMLHDAVYRALESEGYLDDDSEDWNLGDSDQDE